MTEFSVRVLGEDDWAQYRRLRLASLENDPDAFAASVAEEQEYDEALWRARMRRGRRLIASRDDDDVGVASVSQARDEDGVQEGIAELFGMWVRPDARGTGVAWELVTAAADQARREGHRHLRLWVATDNGRAVGFASSYGFRPADDRRPMSTDHSVEEIAMTLPLG
ncbi:MAG: GNAT family N-acetyltransferase [Nocardioidaceae bacterium]